MHGSFPLRKVPEFSAGPAYICFYAVIKNGGISNNVILYLQGGWDNRAVPPLGTQQLHFSVSLFTEGGEHAKILVAVHCLNSFV